MPHRRFCWVHVTIGNRLGDIPDTTGVCAAGYRIRREKAANLLHQAGGAEMKRSITGALVATFVTAAAATAVPMGFVAPANADPSPLNGSYAIVGGADGIYVTATSNCPTATEGCTANLSSNRGWTSVATLTNGRWNFTVTKPDGIVCADGSYAPVSIAYSIDAATLAGVLTTDSNGECPGGQITQGQFQLQKVG
jgi:hypothetical protein